MGKGAFWAEVQWEQKLRGVKTLANPRRGEQSHVASSSLDVRGKWSEVGLERYAGPTS